MQSREYVFKQDNPFLSCLDPMEEGCKLMKDGRLSDAILAFEAEVQRSPSNAVSQLCVDLLCRLHSYCVCVCVFVITRIRKLGVS